MSSINSEILGLAKSITEKLDQPSDSEAEFDIKSPRKNKTKVEHVFKTPNLPLSTVSKIKSNIPNASVDLSSERMNNEREEASKNDETQKSSAGRPLPSQFSAMKPTEISANSLMSLELEDISEDEELWLIMAPKDCKLKKQSVEMDGRNELKGGKFEIEFFRSDSENNMVALVCDNEKLVAGPHFKGCVQISEKLQTFSPKYHDIVKKENPIPSGLKQRYVPFGADIDGVRVKRGEDSSMASKGHRKETSGNAVDLDKDTKAEKLEDIDGRIIPEVPSTTDRKESKKLKRKHSVIESTVIPMSEVNISNDSQDTELTVNSESSKKKKKKKRKIQHKDE